MAIAADAIVAHLLHSAGVEVLMIDLRSFAWAGALALTTPAIAWTAQPPWDTARSPAYQSGFERGERAGRDDARKGDRYDFADESDYRRADSGYRNQYGDRNRYRETFRYGFETGYRSGYSGVSPSSAYGRSPYDVSPYSGRAASTTDPAFERGYDDGYEAGLRDARDRERRDPISEGRYRSADRGYKSSFGSKESYKNRYRVAFRNGYEQAYADARRYTDRGWRGLFGR